MENDIFNYVFKLIIFLPLTICLIYFLSKFSQKGIVGINKSRCMKIIDKIQVSRDNSIVIVEVGKQYFLMSSCNGRMDILKELSEDEVSSHISSNENIKVKFDLANLLRKKEG